VITLKMDVRMKKAVQKIAEKKFMSMSGYLKAALEKQLQADGVDWRVEKKKASDKNS